MVSFVESSLAPDERIIRVAKLHWALFLVSGIILFFGILSSLQAPNGPSLYVPVSALICIMIVDFPADKPLIVKYACRA